MNEPKKSDPAILAMKPTNKAGAITVAELVERRAGAEGNANQQSTHRTQCRERVTQALGRVRQAAKARRKERFTALLHHVNIDLLRLSFYALKRNAAPGVDGVTWQDYEADLESNLRDLHARVHRGAYRAKPSRRRYIPKPDGRQRPLGIRALEDKVLQRAVVAVLNAIYDEDFRGFSYGFRPKRSQHDALDALIVGIDRKKVNWILDLDVRDFLDPSSHYTPVCWLRFKEIWKSCRYLDSQAFSSPAADVDGMQLATLYTLQDRLARDIEQMSGLEHRHITIRDVIHKERPQFVSQTDAPRRAWGNLLSCDEAIIEPAMQGRGRKCECVRGALDSHAFSVLSLLGGFEAGDFPVRAQTAHAICGERQTRCALASLTIEDAGDDGIRIVCGES